MQSEQSNCFLERTPLSEVHCQETHQVQGREFGDLLAPVAIKDSKETRFGVVQVQEYAVCILLQENCAMHKT